MYSTVHVLVPVRVQYKYSTVQVPYGRRQVHTTVLVPYSSTVVLPTYSLDCRWLLYEYRTYCTSIPAYTVRVSCYTVRTCTGTCTQYVLINVPVPVPVPVPVLGYLYTCTFFSTLRGTARRYNVQYKYRYSTSTCMYSYRTVQCTVRPLYSYILPVRLLSTVRLTVDYK